MLVAIARLEQLILACPGVLVPIFAYSLIKSCLSLKLGKAASCPPLQKLDSTICPK
jgi:hypothetical protein